MPPVNVLRMAGSPEASTAEFGQNQRFKAEMMMREKELGIKKTQVQLEAKRLEYERQQAETNNSTARYGIDTNASTSRYNTDQTREGYREKNQTDLEINRANNEGEDRRTQWGLDLRREDQEMQKKIFNYSATQDRQNRMDRAKQALDEANGKQRTNEIARTTGKGVAEARAALTIAQQREKMTSQQAAEARRKSQEIINNTLLPQAQTQAELGMHAVEFGGQSLARQIFSGTDGLDKIVQAPLEDRSLEAEGKARSERLGVYKSYGINPNDDPSFAAEQLAPAKRPLDSNEVSRNLIHAMLPDAVEHIVTGNPGAATRVTGRLSSFFSDLTSLQQRAQTTNNPRLLFEGPEADALRQKWAEISSSGDVNPFALSAMVKGISTYASSIRDKIAHDDIQDKSTTEEEKAEFEGWSRVRSNKYHRALLLRGVNSMMGTAKAIESIVGKDGLMSPEHLTSLGRDIDLAFGDGLGDVNEQFANMPAGPKRDYINRVMNESGAWEAMRTRREAREAADQASKSLAQREAELNSQYAEVEGDMLRRQGESLSEEVEPVDVFGPPKSEAKDEPRGKKADKGKGKGNKKNKQR